ncbi:MAG: hypothetical protein OXN79_11160, partial [bacterium]|nr:hypothetical protein [bacterium]
MPAAMAVYRPSGAVDWPLLLSPQHWAVPVGRIPQVCQAPAVMAVNCPSGGFDCPWWSDPQQWAVLSSRSPQVCWVP